MRCTEIVLAVLSDPAKIDPWAAIIIHAILNIKRLISKRQQRCSDFITNIKKVQSQPDSKIQGPAHTFLKFLQILELDLDINEHDKLGNHGTIWISDKWHANLLEDT